jgi:N-acetylglucosaminyldiphosphoundecaprenol N-acetyl-beta-D-mannosaminyltransferase
MATIQRPLLGIRIGVDSLKNLIGSAMRAVEERQPPFTFACANPHSLVVARRDESFGDALRSCSAVVADGVGVTMAGKVTGVDVGPRITGADFFLSLMSELNRRGGRVFFFGSSPQVLAQVLSRARRDYPNLYIEGISPPYGVWSQESNEAFIAAIRDAQPDVLWVGMTAPRQEKWVHENAATIGVPVFGSIGAVFDYYAGTVQRAPEWICGLGLEWLYRLTREPRRLWRRTLVSAPQFLWLVAREHAGYILRSVARGAQTSRR